ncbi:hypothetical protein AB3N59_13340 [Leptospira sp. WS92.C1]
MNKRSLFFMIFFFNTNCVVMPITRGLHDWITERYIPHSEDYSKITGIADIEDPDRQAKPECIFYSNSYINKITYHCPDLAISYNESSGRRKFLNSKKWKDFQTFLSEYDSKLNTNGRLYFTNSPFYFSERGPYHKKSILLTPYFDIDCCKEEGFYTIHSGIVVKKVYLVNDRLLYFVENNNKFYSYFISFQNRRIRLLPHGQSAELASITSSMLRPLLVEKKLPENRIDLTIQEENPNLVFLLLPPNMFSKAYPIYRKNGYESTNIDLKKEYYYLEDKVKIRHLASPAYLLSVPLDIVLFPANLILLMLSLSITRFG